MECILYENRFEASCYNGLPVRRSEQSKISFKIVVDTIDKLYCQICQRVSLLLQFAYIVHDNRIGKLLKLKLLSGFFLASSLLLTKS